jgi:hypothetical protein
MPQHPSPEFLQREHHRLSKLFAHLDLDRPELGSVKAAWARRDLDGACDALLAHYADARLDPILKPAAWGSEELHLRSAENLLDDVFEFQGLKGKQPRRLEGGLDWLDRGPRDDPEWSWFLNRHGFFQSLLVAWRATGKTVFGAAIDAHLVDWVRNQPRPRGFTFAAPWRPLEAARRVTIAWPELFFANSPETALGPEARLLMLASLPDHGRALCRRHSLFGNRLVTEMAALATVSVAWPEFRDSNTWLDYAARRGRRELFKQTYPDGAHTELSNHYQKVTVLEFQRLCDLLDLAEKPHEADAMRLRLKLMWDYFAGVTRPDGKGPLNNDGGLEDNAAYLRSAAAGHGRTDWLHIATRGRKGEPPANPPSRYYPWAGQAIMRSGWSDDAQWARFDIGPHGSDHQHHDQLSLEVMAGGRMFLVDPGRYTYKPGKERDYFAGPEGHNVIRLDGIGSTPPPHRVKAPLPAVVVREPDYDYFAQTVSFTGKRWRGQGPRHWTRVVVYMRGSYWVVVDHLEVFGDTEVTASWHFHPDSTVALDGAIAWTTNRGTTNLALIPSEPSLWKVSNYHGQSEPDFKGWYSNNYNQRHPCTLLEYRTRIRSPTVFCWLLFPQANGEPATDPSKLSVRSSQNAHDVCRVTVVRPGDDREDTMLLPLRCNDQASFARGSQAEHSCKIFRGETPHGP